MVVLGGGAASHERGTLVTYTRAFNPNPKTITPSQSPYHASSVSLSQSFYACSVYFSDCSSPQTQQDGETSDEDDDDEGSDQEGSDNEGDEEKSGQDVATPAAQKVLTRV